MEIQEILNKVITLNTKAINLNKENERRRVDKEYAKRDLENQLVELNKLNPNFNLSLEDPDFEIKLKELKKQVVDKITQDTEHLESVITAQETGDIAKLEELTGVFIGRKNLSDVVKLNEVPEEKAETMAIQDVSSIETVTSTPEQKLESKTDIQNTQASTGGLFEGMAEQPQPKQPSEPISNESDVETEDTTQPKAEPQSVKDVQNLFSGMMQGGINNSEPEQETPQPTQPETQPTQPTQPETQPEVQPETETVNTNTSTPDFNFGSFFK